MAAPARHYSFWGNFPGVFLFWYLAIACFVGWPWALLHGTAAWVTGILWNLLFAGPILAYQITRLVKRGRMR